MKEQEQSATPTTEAPMLTIGLLWHSLSSDNLGVGALTESQLHICREAAQRAGVRPRFIIFGSGAQRRSGIDAADVQAGGRVSIKQMLLGRSAFLKELEGCDLVLDIGEGDSFTDIYGLKRYLFMIVSKLAVLAKGKPLILSPQTIGPFDRWTTRRIAAAVMRRCTRVFARDQLSSAYLRQLGVTANVDEAIDVAFKLPFQPRSRTPGRTAIGLNVSGLIFSGGYSGSNQFGLSLDYATLVRDLLRHWTADPDNEVWLVPHVLPDHLPRDDDRVAIRQLAAEFPTARCAPEFASPGAAKSFIAGMDFVTGARMHACIAAFSSGVPVVPMAYSRKFNGLFASLGYGWIVDGKTMSNAQALEMTLKAFANRTQLALDVAAGTGQAGAKLDRYCDFLADTLSRRAPRPSGSAAVLREEF